VRSVVYGCLSLLALITAPSFTEVVLALLIKSFHIAPTGKKVVWLWHGVAQPTTEDAPTDSTGTKQLQLPLLVRRV
jgi:hypothetical protein